MLMKMSSQMKRTNNQKGFTLVELMVVVVIIGILVAVAVPVYNSVTHKANKKAVEANLRTIDGAIMQYQAAKDVTTAPTLDDDANTGLVPNYIASVPTGPSGVTSYGISGNSATVTLPANPYGTTVGAGTYSLKQLKDDASTTGW